MNPVGTELLPLFSQPTARHTDPETSWQAAAKKQPTTATDRAKVLDALLQGPASDFTIAERTGIIPTSCGVRRGELVKAGLVKDSGKREKNERGSTVIVWCLS